MPLLLYDYVNIVHTSITSFSNHTPKRTQQCFVQEGKSTMQFPIYHHSSKSFSQHLSCTLLLFGSGPPRQVTSLWSPTHLLKLVLFPIPLDVIFVPSQ